MSHLQRETDNAAGIQEILELNAGSMTRDHPSTGAKDGTTNLTGTAKRKRRTRSNIWAQSQSRERNLSVGHKDIKANLDSAVCEVTNNSFVL